MKRQEAEALILKYTEGNCTPDERRLVEAYFLKYLQAGEQLPAADRLLADHEEVWTHLAAYIGEEQAVVQHQVKTVKLWPKIAVAAAAVTAMVFGLWFYTSRHLDTPSSRTVGRDLLNDIAPGKNGATITLASGEVIELSGDKKGVVIGSDLKYADNSPVISNEERDLLDSTGKRSLSSFEMTAETKKGQTYQFTLPDGTHVWLNADSKISFPSQFDGQERKILLTGEGYFEVAKDKAHPFIVKTSTQSVTVLGTHFNINSYADDMVTTTTLVEGSVKVSAFDSYAGGSSVVLKPNQQSIQNPTGGMQVRDVDVAEAVDWKNGDFIFREEPLAEIMRSVGRWYGVDLVYDKDVDQLQTFSGSVSRSKPISAILGIMQSTGQVKFKIAGKKIYINK